MNINEPVRSVIVTCDTDTVTATWWRGNTARTVDGDSSIDEIKQRLVRELMGKVDRYLGLVPAPVWEVIGCTGETLHAEIWTARGARPTPP
jgi:hypothetical protein